MSENGTPNKCTLYDTDPGTPTNPPPAMLPQKFENFPPDVHHKIGQYAQGLEWSLCTNICITHKDKTNCTFHAKSAWMYNRLLPQVNKKIKANYCKREYIWEESDMTEYRNDGFDDGGYILLSSGKEFDKMFERFYPIRDADGYIIYPRQEIKSIYMEISKGNNLEVQCTFSDIQRCIYWFTKALGKIVTEVGAVFCKTCDIETSKINTNTLSMEMNRTFNDIRCPWSLFVLQRQSNGQQLFYINKPSTKKYNLVGNMWFRAGPVAKAVLHYIAKGEKSKELEKQEYKENLEEIKKLFIEWIGNVSEMVSEDGSTAAMDKKRFIISSKVKNTFNRISPEKGALFSLCVHCGKPRQTRFSTCLANA